MYNMDIILHSTLSLWCFITILSAPAHGELVRLQAAENTTVQFACPSPPEYTFRVWYWGLFTTSEAISANRPPKIYVQLSAQGVNMWNVATNEITADRDTFTLTLSPVTLRYNSNFTCRVVTSRYILLHNIELQVYIQSQLVMTGLDTPVKENDTVTVSCTVARLYPPLEVPANFTLTWGQDAPISATQTANSDGKTFSYSVQVQKNVSQEDHRKAVTCSITPSIGRPAAVTKRLNVQYIALTPPTFTIYRSQPFLEDEVRFTCNGDKVPANPQVSSVKWFKDGAKLHDYPTSMFTHKLKAALNDSGSYSCSVGNVAGFSDVSTSKELNVIGIVNPCAASNIGVIVGGVIGGLFIIVFGIVMVVFLILKYRTLSTSAPAAPTEMVHTSPPGGAGQPGTNRPDVVEPPTKNFPESGHLSQHLTTAPIYEVIADGSSQNSAYVNDS